MTRIIAGTWGGRTLQVPRSGSRPTSERVREALFSRLEHLDVLDAAYVLDLYAGSGALGLEALSRGADRADLVEKSEAASTIIARNIRTLGATSAHVHRVAARRFVQTTDLTFSLVFADPPYDLPAAELEDVFTDLLTRNLLEAGSLIVLEQSRRAPALTWPRPLEVTDERRYGDTRITFVEN